MNAIMNDARTTLSMMKIHEVIRTTMDENMQKLLADCETNQKKADLWKRNPITGKKVKEKYNNRCNGSMR